MRNAMRRILASAGSAALLVAGAAGAYAASSNVDLGVPIWNFVAPNAMLLTGANGTSWVATASGYPAILGEVNPETGSAEDAVRLPDAHSAWAYSAGAAGAVYIGTGPFGAVYQYTPGSSQVTLLATVGTGRPTVWSVAYDPDNDTLYAGTDQKAQLYAIDLASGNTVTDLGTMLTGHRSVRSMMYANGVVYCGIGSKAGVVAYDVATGKASSILPAKYAMQSDVDSLSMADGYLFVHLTDYVELVMNPSTGAVRHVISNVRSRGVTAETSQNWVALVVGNQVDEYSPSTAALTPVSTDLPAPDQKYLGTVGAAAVAVANLKGGHYPGPSVVGMGSKGTYWVENPKDNFLASGPITLDASVGDIESIAAGPDGTIYGSSYQSGGTFIYPGSGTAIDDQNLTGPGQAEDMLWANGKMYFGIYPGATIWTYDPAQPWNWGPYASGTENPSLVATVGDGQDRPMALAAGPDGTVYVGTVPDANELGGALTILPAGGGKAIVEKNLIPNQSPISLTYADGMIVGATTVAGGLGATATASAGELFTANAQTGQLVSTLTPFPGVPTLSGLVTGLNGLVYGLTHTTVFAYDPELNTIVGENAYAPTQAQQSNWGNALSMVVGSDGNLYGSADGNLIEVNPQTLAVTTLVRSGVERVVESSDGRVYYSGDSGTHLEELLSVLPQSGG